MIKVYAVWLSEVIVKCMGCASFENQMEVGKAILAAKDKGYGHIVSEHNFFDMEAAKKFYNEKVAELNTFIQMTQVGEELTIEEAELLTFDEYSDGEMENICVEKYEHSYVETKEDA